MNRDLHRACRFLCTVAILVSCGVAVLAPLYFVSRDVYEDDGRMEHAVESLAEMTRRSGHPGPRMLSSSRTVRVGGVQISRYEPIGTTDPSASDDERQYLGRAQIPMRDMGP
mmetsp:Transcript_1198/g.4684  ORF Transcript_1198/g.4684 Transcript_1198/m.4684 type:complete len:112 (-) Transcript_1198:179-514(-)